MTGTLAQAQEVSFPVSALVPLAVGFFGLGTGYLIYGPQELLRLPGRDRCEFFASLYARPVAVQTAAVEGRVWGEPVASHSGRDVGGPPSGRWGSSISRSGCG
jgi:hypothetical protein